MGREGDGEDPSRGEGTRSLGGATPVAPCAKGFLSVPPSRRHVRTRPSANLGGLGSIIVIVSFFFLFIPFVSSILWVLGFVLVLFAVGQIASVARDQKVATNYLIAVVAGLVGLIIANLFLWNQLLEIFPELTEGRYPTSATPEQIRAFYTAGGIFVAIAWPALLISAFFLKRSYDRIAENLKMPTFGTVAWFYVVGAITTIVFIGFLILPFVWIFQAVAFFALPSRAPGPGPRTTAAEPPA